MRLVVPEVRSDTAPRFVRDRDHPAQDRPPVTLDRFTGRGGTTRMVLVIDEARVEEAVGDLAGVGPSGWCLVLAAASFLAGAGRGVRYVGRASRSTSRPSVRRSASRPRARGALRHRV